MGKPKLPADFLPKLPDGHFWRLKYDCFGFYALEIRRDRKLWFSKFIAQALCPLNSFMGSDATVALSQSADVALSRAKQDRESMSLLQKLAQYEGSHRG